MSLAIVGYESAITKTTFPGGESCIRLNKDCCFLEDALRSFHANV